MIYKISGEQPFQVLSDSFSVSPSESGYNLYLSADGVNYSQFATVAANTTRQFTGMNNGNYYILSGNTSEVQVNWNRDCGGGGGGTAGVSSLDGQTGALTTKTVGGQSILGSGDIEVGSSPVYNLSTMTQSERAALNASLLAASETERIGANVYIEEARCNYDRVESNKIRFICDFINSDNGYPVQISYIFWLLSDGSYEWDSSSNGNHFALPATYYADYTDTAHTLYTGTTAFWGAGRALGDGVEINVVLLDGPKSDYSVQNLCTSKSAYIERTGDWTGIIGATFEYSGQTIEAKWSYNENTATLISWNTGGGAGPTIIDFDVMTQQERADLATTLNALDSGGSGSTINQKYQFYISLSGSDGNNWYGVRVQFYRTYYGRCVFGTVLSDTDAQGHIPPRIFEANMWLAGDGSWEATNVYKFEQSS